MTSKLIKFAELYSLNEGDVVELEDGEEVEFVRLTNQGFLGEVNGTEKHIHLKRFKRVKERLDKREDEKTEECSTLEEGELYYIKEGNNAVLYKYVEITGGNLVGINIITGEKTIMPVSYYEGKVSDID